jgi:peptidoglycan/xylan/chitin deacetylase (PgdA/CDA1 family)
MLTTPEIRRELSHSKQQLENMLNKTVKSICYPQGRYDDTVCEVAREVGYQVGFTTRPSICGYPLRGLDLYKIPRLTVVGDSPCETHFSLGKIAVNNLFRRNPWKTPKSSPKKGHFKLDPETGGPPSLFSQGRKVKESGRAVRIPPRKTAKR